MCADDLSFATMTSNQLVNLLANFDVYACRMLGLSLVDSSYLARLHLCIAFPLYSAEF